jgi:hypothetical protein
MSIKFIAVVLAAVIAAAGVLSFSNSRPSNETANYQNANAPVVKTALAAESSESTDLYIGDFKTGYADGFNAGVTGLSYPEQSAMASNSRGYLDGFSQGYTDGQGQQSTLRSQLCRTAGAAFATAAPAVYGESYGRSYARRASTRTLGDRAYNDDYYYSPRERVDRGIGTTARRALMIAGGTAAGAGLGAVVGGKKGAIIGALVGGGTGTALALTKKPNRAFDRRISKKSVLTKTLIGAGAGAAIGAITRGKRGALAGAALGGGGGAIWSLLSGKRATRRY